MDAFFASVEMLRYPQLKGLAVVVGAGHGQMDARLEQLRRDQPHQSWTQEDRSAIPLRYFPRLRDYRGRGVITTATYEARHYGIGSAMGLMKAAHLCPDAILLPVDFKQYRKYSSAFKRIIQTHASLMENRSIDEVYIDFSQARDGLLQGGRVLAQRIQDDIFAATGLTCSIGVAPNKLMAKMASEFDKPRGISILETHDLKTRIWPLPCRKINGVGPKTDAKLKRLGIQTIAQLAACDTHWLIQHFGPRQGLWLHKAAHGEDDRPVKTHTEPVSISRETTFARDLHAVHDKRQLGMIFSQLARQLAADLQNKGYAGRTVGIKIRFDNFQIITRDQSFETPTNDAQKIRLMAGQCLKRVDLSRRLRLLGIRMASLISANDLDASNREEKIPSLF